MKVILNRDVPNLGEEGDICEVARGYARNYLIPRNMVLMHNRQNVAIIEGRRAAIEQRKTQKRKDASSIKERIENEELSIRMAAGERGKLFGSVTTATIVDELEKLGISVERRRLEIADGTIKSVGIHTVRVRLYGDEEAILTVRVESETPEREQPAASAEPVAAAGEPQVTGGDAAAAAEADIEAPVTADQADAPAAVNAPGEADADSDARRDESAT
ncbi:MAG: 50S ribosomal protein L9 [Spirochaetaceae bacterium]|nr:MAG: 50S ribosomal protein L9 [Spirochaetaceae bacterium]